MLTRVDVRQCLVSCRLENDRGLKFHFTNDQKGVVYGWGGGVFTSP